MSYKVKYSRKEYREEYLKSEEWKKLRGLILDSNPECQCCKKTKANDVHHMTYRNIVDVKVTDLLPVCRACHEYIHDAIDDGWISLSEGELERNKERTLAIHDGEYAIHRKWLKEKHLIPDWIKKETRGSLNNGLIKRISGIANRTIRYETLDEIKITGSQIKKIERYIRVLRFRRKENLPISPDNEREIKKESVPTVKDFYAREHLREVKPRANKTKKDKKKKWPRKDFFSEW